MNSSDVDVIPVGTFCQLAASLERMQLLDTKGYPFNFLRSNPVMVGDCIKTRFRTFLDRQNYTTMTEGKLDKGIGIRGYGHDVFLHHYNVFDEHTYNKFVQKAERFLQTLRNGKRKVFLVLYQPWTRMLGADAQGDDVFSATSDGRYITGCRYELTYLHDAIRAFTPDDFQLIGVVNYPSRNRRTDMIVNTRKYKLYRFTTDELSQGCFFYRGKHTNDESRFQKFLWSLLRPLGVHTSEGTRSTTATQPPPPELIDLPAQVTFPADYAPQLWAPVSQVPKAADRPWDMDEIEQLPREASDHKQTQRPHKRSLLVEKRGVKRSRQE
jgi:hypothetical protein